MSQFQDPYRPAYAEYEQIGSFEVSRPLPSASVEVIDRDSFNRWPRRTFATLAEARIWALSADQFKTGRAFHS